MTEDGTTAFTDAANTWNRRFEGDEFLFGVEPNDGFGSMSRSGLPADAFCASPMAKVAIACGWRGKGSCVDAFDIAEVGVAKARRFAARQGVTVNYSVADCDAYAWPRASVDGVAAIFIQFADPAQRERLFAHILDSSEGLAAFSFCRATRPSSSSTAPAARRFVSHLYTPELLRAAFADLEVLELREYEADVAEGTGHRGRSALIGLVARRR